MAARQVPPVLAQHGDHLDPDLLARARVARDGDARRRRAGLAEMPGTREGRRLEIRHRAVARIPAVHLHDVIEAGAELGERCADLLHYLIGLADDVSGAIDLALAVDGRLAADENHLAAAERLGEAFGQWRQRRR